MITRQKRGDLDILVIENKLCTAQVSVFGAHVLSYIPKHDQRDRLWVSKDSKFDRSRPIRGGIPICWPWFGDAPQQFTKMAGTLPAHGYIRTQDCVLVSADSLSDGCDQLIFKPQRHPFPTLNLELDLEIIITVGETLSVQLVTRNTSSLERDFFAALHSYFAVDAIQEVSLEGVDVDYLDKVQAMKSMPALIRYTIDSETDRVHLGTCPEITLNEPQHKTSISSQGNDSIVVWNPWQGLSMTMSDMQDTGYQKMLCVETARTQNGTIAGLQTHILTQTIA